MKNSKRYIFNHFYQLRHDLKRTHIFSPEWIENDKKPFVNLNWSSKIHPVYAMIFSFFSNPVEISEVIKKIATFFEVPDEKAEALITPFLSCTETFHTEYAGEISNFPKNIIIEADKLFSNTIRQYSPQQFVYKELDLEQERYNIVPQGIVFMINNTCATDCMYCYADRSFKSKLIPLDKIKSIIKEARKVGIASFSLTGGEFFLYKNWKELLNELIANNYKPSLISTKVPLKEKDVLEFKAYDIGVQISLDSLTKGSLTKILSVKEDYLEKIKKTITLLDQNNIPFQVSTVLITENAKIENLEKIHEFLVQFKNIARWEIRPAFKSLYSKDNFNEFKISSKTIEEFGKWAKFKQTTTKFEIMPPGDSNGKYLQTSEGSRKFLGSKCSANSSHMVLLPDGKVTICEQLYWDPRFIIGDLTEQTIAEVWSSSRALELAFPDQKEFSDESACKTCVIFDECFSFPNKCFADVIKAYGKENWDFPDPRCKKAPDLNDELIYS